MCVGQNIFMILFNTEKHIVEASKSVPRNISNYGLIFRQRQSKYLKQSFELIFWFYW